MRARGGLLKIVESSSLPTVNEIGRKFDRSPDPAAPFLGWLTGAKLSWLNKEVCHIIGNGGRPWVTGLLRPVVLQQGDSMFIKWRTYQRQLNGIKGDKYIQQPIIVSSFRIGKKGMREHMDEEMVNLAWQKEEFRKKVKRPRHEVICKLPSFPACMVIYFRNPEWMAKRYAWWEGVDTIFSKLVENERMPEQTANKLKANIEKVVPRVTPEEEEKLKVVLNDLPLHL
ncbi:MAG: hypothetical protein HN416_17795 [Nitrospina sp.]|jgi:hypothetical protein|nr:hypothetical protein [Nitrospina sp.]